MDIAEKAAEFVEEHPTGVTIGAYIGTFAVMIPLSVWMYRFMGKTAGKSAAQELLKAGFKTD